MGHSRRWGPGGEGTAMGAETWGTAADGARDGAETRGAQRGSAWAHVRGVDAGETHAMAMCALRGPGCTWRMHEGYRQGRQQPVVHGLGAEAVALQVDGPREAFRIRQVMWSWPGAVQRTEAAWGPVVSHWP